mgnify:CR=1 FL=1
MKEYKTEPTRPCPNGIVNCGNFSGGIGNVINIGSLWCRMCFSNKGKNEEGEVKCGYEDE